MNPNSARRDTLTPPQRGPTQPQPPRNRPATPQPSSNRPTTPQLPSKRPATPQLPSSRPTTTPQTSNRPAMPQPTANRPAMPQPTANRPASGNPTLNRLSVVQSPPNRPGMVQSPPNGPGLVQSPPNRPGIGQPPFNRPSVARPPLNRPSMARPPFNRPIATIQRPPTTQALGAFSPKSPTTPPTSSSAPRSQKAPVIGSLPTPRPPMTQATGTPTPKPRPEVVATATTTASAQSPPEEQAVTKTNPPLPHEPDTAGPSSQMSGLPRDKPASPASPQATASTQAVEPTQATEPVRPTQHTKTDQPTEPAQPTEPTEAAKSDDDESMAEVEAKEDADSAGDDDDDGDDDGETCAVCHTGHSGPGNFIVICEGKCELSFHQKCYGIADIPPGDEPWYCDWCAGGNKTHFGKQLYCCHYKSDKATRFLNVVGKEGEQHYVHIQCAAWNPDIDTSHLPFTTTLRKVKASWSKCILCSGRFGYQLHCAHVENGNPCQAAFHPMCAFRHGFLPPPSDYQAKYEICYCPDHAADSEVTASTKDGADPSAEDDRVATSNEDQLARRRTLPSYFSTGARPNSDAQRENVRLSTAQEWPTKRRYRTSRLDSREPPPSKPPASAVGVVGHLPPSLDDDVSDTTRSAVSLSGTAATSITPDRRNRGRPRRRQSSMDVDSNSEAATSRKTSVSISIPTSSVIEGEESVTGSDRVDAPPTRSSSHRRSLTRDANSDAQGNSTLRSGAPSIEKGCQKSPVTPKLKLSLSRAAEAAGPSNKQPGASEAANDFVAKGAQPASAGAATVPLPVVGSVAAQLPSAGALSAQSASLLNSNSDQISPYAAFVKRPNIRIKPFSQASSMSPTSGVSPGTHPYSAGNRGYTSLLAPAGLHARPSPAAALSDDQATMLKESHFMLQKYGDMLGDMNNMIRGISIMPAPRTYEPMNVASSMSAPVSNGMGPPVAFRSPPMMLPQQIPPYHPYARPPPPPAQAQFRMPVAGTFPVRPMPPSFPSAHTIHLPQTTAPFRPPYVPNTSAPQQGQLPHHSTPPVAELPPPPFPQASSDHAFTATMPSSGPQDIAPWAGSPASGNSRVKRKRATPPSDHYSNGSDSSWPACSRQRQNASPAPYVYSPMDSPASLADPSRRVYPQGTNNMLKEPAGAISDSVRRPYTRSTCIQAGSTLLNYANPLVDMEIEMEELKDNIIYLIQGINMPQALLDTMMPSASPDAASDASTNPENQDRIVALGLLTEELQKIGKLTKFNVADYVGVLVDAMQAVKRSKK